MKKLFFFIGTEAELIKIFPVIIECERHNLEYAIIASGQNDITGSRILDYVSHGKVELELSKESEIKKSTIGLFKWWLNTYNKSISVIKNSFLGVDFSKSKMIVHGDTVSTFMGALIGKKLGMTVCHVEAGLRSHNIFNPFPEEIDRMLTSRIARVHFAPGNEAEGNLNKARGMVVNTVQNTLLDSLRFSYEIKVNEQIERIIGKDYFVFVMHRQENLAKKGMVKAVVKEIIAASQNRVCVVILHQITKNILESLGLLGQLESNKNIILLPRVDYFDFMKLLRYSRFVITDGGSNQEELFYMGKPCLIMRKATERKEGLGANAKLFTGNISEISAFIKSYHDYEREEIKVELHPSNIIVKCLI